MFRYWTVLQIPNFLLAAPVLTLSLFASYDYYRANLSQVIQTTLPFLPLKITAAKSDTKPTSPFYSPTLIPFIHLHTALTLLLLFASHVQIILRVCVTNPVPFWYVSDLLQSQDRESELGQMLDKILHNMGIDSCLIMGWLLSPCIGKQCQYVQSQRSTCQGKTNPRYTYPSVLSS